MVRADRLLVDSSAPIVADGAVLVEGDRILDVGTWASLQYRVSAGDEVVTLGDATLMPGLFDCHVHLSFDPGSGTTTTKSSLKDSEILELMRSNAAKLLDAGVTTARDLGAPGTLAATIKQEVLIGKIPGPSLLIANAPITVRGGHASAMGGEADGVDEVRAAVRQRAAEGADLVKVMTTGGFMTPGSHPWQARYSVEELTAIVEEAHSLGLLTTTHALGAEGIERAVDAGFDAIEHCGWVTESGTRFDDRIAEKIVRQGVFISPTMNSACMAHDYFCPWDKREAVLTNLSALHKLGAKIIAGTDAGIGLVHFERLIDGLSVFADVGMTPRQIIASATDVAAEACGLSRLTGRLIAGLRADVIAVEGDPTQSYELLGEPRFVMAAGRRYQPRSIPPRDSNSEQVRQIHATLSSGAGRRVQN